MHCLDVILARNAEASGISVQQNLAEAKAGQFITIEARAGGASQPQQCFDQHFSATTPARQLPRSVAPSIT